MVIPCCRAVVTVGSNAVGVVPERPVKPCSISAKKKIDVPICLSPFANTTETWAVLTSLIGRFWKFGHAFMAENGIFNWSCMPSTWLSQHRGEFTNIPMADWSHEWNMCEGLFLFSLPKVKPSVSEPSSPKILTLHDGVEKGMVYRHLWIVYVAGFARNRRGWSARVAK